MHVPKVRCVRTADFGADGDPHAIELSADKLSKVRSDRIRWRSMMKQSYLAAQYIRGEAIPRLSSNQHPIPGDQRLIWLRFDVDGLASLLNEEVDVVPVIRNRGFESDGQSCAGISLRQGMDCVERIIGLGSAPQAPGSPAAVIAKARINVRIGRSRTEPVGCSPVSLPSPMFLISHRCPNDPVLHIHARRPVIAGGGSMPQRPILHLLESVLAELGVGSCDWIFSSS